MFVDDSVGVLNLSDVGVVVVVPLIGGWVFAFSHVVTAVEISEVEADSLEFVRSVAQCFIFDNKWAVNISPDLYSLKVHVFESLEGEHQDLRVFGNFDRFSGIDQ